MPKQDGFIASVSLDAVANGPTVQFIRWQVHGDWVQQVRSVLTACLTGWGGGLHLVVQLYMHLWSSLK